MVTVEELLAEGVHLEQAGKIRRIKIKGFPKTFGFVDEEERIAYLPGNNYEIAMCNRENIDKETRMKIQDAYGATFRNLQEAGYVIRLICDDTD